MANGALPSLCLLLLAVAAAAQAVPPPAPPAAASGCSIVLRLNASESTLSLDGSGVVEPAIAAQPLTRANPEAVVGLEGALTLVLPGTAACPTTAAAVLAALAGATLQTAAPQGPLLLYPPDGITVSNTFVALTLQGVRLDTSAAPLAAGAAAGAFASQLTGTIAEGTVLSVSDIAGTETLPLTGLTSTNASAITAAAQGPTLVVTLPVAWSFRSTYNATILGSPVQGASEYVLTGSIVASATLGCPTACGANGRCAAAADGALGCACECGWSGPACDVPSGFCSPFAAELSSAAVCPVCPDAAPAPPAGDGAPCQAAVCSTTQAYNGTTGRCECLAGWAGPGGCNACETDAACDAYFDVSGSTCSDELAFQQGMQVKAYTCDLAGTGLEQTVEPGSFFIVCNTSANADGAPPASTADQYCEVHFALNGKGDNPITCRASECSFAANATRADCATTQCKCERDCPDVEGILASINGKPCSIDCTPDGQCTFDIQDFFVTLVAPCQAAACVVPGFTFVQGDYRISESTSYDPVIAAIPLMVLVGLAAFLSGYLIRHRALFARSPGSAPAAAAVSNGEAGAVARRRPSQPVHVLTFDNLSYSVPVSHGRRWLPRFLRSKTASAGAPAAAAATVEVGGKPHKPILRSVSGVAANGELVGVLGPSGCGKSTLLSILSGSAEDMDSRGSLTGSVLMDGQPMHTAQRRKIAYVAQDDTLLPTLTVEESVRYSAILRLRGAGAPELQAAVQAVISELGLSHVARSRVGGRSGIRGVSGGERRRVTIAMELVTEPAVLVLDEPTSGLDSHTALTLMRTLRQVAGGGRIVLLSFHQPSPAMFSLLDRAYLMAQGHCIFSGPPGAVEGWFEQHGLPCPVGTTIAEHMLDAVSDPSTLQPLLAAHGKEQQHAAKGVEPREAAQAASEDATAPLVGNISSSSVAKLDAEAATGAPANAGAGAGSERSSEESSWAAGRQRSGLSRELAVVFWRTAVDIRRNPALLWLHWVLALLMGAFVGAVFFDVSFDVSGAQNRVGAMFFCLCFFAFTSLTTVDLFQMERRMVGREVRGGYYSPGAYLLAKMVLDGLLLRVIPVFIFAAPFYPMMGLQTGAAVVATFLFVVATFAGAMGAMSLAVTVGSPTAGLASLIMNIVLLVSVVVSGMLVNPDSMPAWISWTHWCSIFFYAYSALMINEMSAIKIDFTLEGYAAASGVRGTVFLQTIGIDASNLTVDIIVNCCFYLGLALLAFLILYWVMPRPGRLHRSAAKARGGK